MKPSLSLFYSRSLWSLQRSICAEANGRSYPNVHCQSSGKVNSSCSDRKRQNFRKGKATKQTKVKAWNGKSQALFVPAAGYQNSDYLELVEESMVRKGSTTLTNKNGNTTKMESLGSCLKKAGDIQSPWRYRAGKAGLDQMREVQRNSCMDQMLIPAWKQPVRKKPGWILCKIMNFSQSRAVLHIATLLNWRSQDRFMVPSNHSLSFTNYSVFLMVLGSFIAVRHFTVFRYGFNNWVGSHDAANCSQCGDIEIFSAL